MKSAVRFAVCTTVAEAFEEVDRLIAQENIQEAEREIHS